MFKAVKAKMKKKVEKKIEKKEEEKKRARVEKAKATRALNRQQRLESEGGAD